MYPYSGLKLIELLEKQHQQRSNQSDLFKAGTFHLVWRTKVGSFPHPDLETLISAGEPCGAWRTATITKRERNQNREWQEYTIDSRPEDKRNVEDNIQAWPELPLNGYIPGSSIRGVVRAWAKRRADILPRMLELLGNQEDDTITSGKIEFLDAFPEKATKLSLDIVNPQQDFQVYHQGQGTPLSLYTLGNGDNRGIEVKIAIRGIPGKASAEEVSEVWAWVNKAISFYGVGGRSAAGYGAVASLERTNPVPSYSIKQIDFALYSQGNAGPDTSTMELRPSHWRGWLRSWLLRFFLGVMSPDHAKLAVAELMGSLEPETRKGCVRVKMIPGQTWNQRSSNNPRFYAWKGKLEITAPTRILNRIVIPILRIAVMVGGVGRGWRRPLHIFVMRHNGRDAARGGYLRLSHRVRSRKESDKYTNKPFGLALRSEEWNKLYRTWLTSVSEEWTDRYVSPENLNPSAEVFSPNTCTVYAVPGPLQEPINQTKLEWNITNPIRTRGEGMNLIYKDKYKRKVDVGGNAAGGGNAHCSWVSIKRDRIPREDACQEIVCLFMGGEEANSDHLRAQFLEELASRSGAIHIFGVQP